MGRITLIKQPQTNVIHDDYIAKNFKIIQDFLNGEYVPEENPDDPQINTDDIVITEDIVANIQVGGISVNKKITKGTTLTQLAKMLTQGDVPLTFEFTASADPDIIREENVDSIRNNILACNITSLGSSKSVDYIEFLDGNDNLLSKKMYVAGTTRYTFTDTSNVSSSMTYKCRVVYKNFNNVTTTSEVQEISYKFVIYGHYGLVQNPTIASYNDLINLGNTNKSGTSELTFNNVNCVYQNIVYAYPKTFGELESILCNGFNYMNSFDKKEVVIPVNGRNITFLVYSFMTNISGVTFTFK